MRKLSGIGGGMCACVRTYGVECVGMSMERSQDAHLGQYSIETATMDARQQVNIA